MSKLLTRFLYRRLFSLGMIIGVMKGETRSLDHSSHIDMCVYIHTHNFLKNQKSDGNMRKIE